MASLFSSNFSNSSKQGKNAKNPLEILKDSSASVANDSARTEASLEKRQEQKSKQALGFGIERVKEEQRIIYNRQQRETQEEIKELQQAIVRLMQTAENLERHVEIAAKKTIINPGKYDISFLKKLKLIITQFLEKAEDAPLWLAAFNQKGQKKGFFWSKFASKRGGAQFLLSPDSYAARSAG